MNTIKGRRNRFALNFSLVRYITSLLLIFLSLASFAQVGGTYAYAFLSNATSSRVTGLGGMNITLSDFDPSVQLSNPALLNPTMHRHISVSQIIQPGGINFGNVAYVHDFKKYGTWGFGVQYAAYGSIKTTDEASNITGDMNPGEVNIYGGGSYRFGKLFSVGANLKIITSHLAQYTSVGMAADFGATVRDPKNIVLFSIAAKNLGGQLKSYTDTKVKEPIPFNLQAGLSFGFKEVPIRIHFNVHDLTNWNLRYANPADDVNQNLFQDSATTKKKSYAGDEFFRHVVIGVEANIKKIVYIDFAYNHQNRMEYKQETRRGLAGFSMGLGVHVKQIMFHFGLQAKPLKQTMAQFTLNVNTAGFVKKKK